MKKLSEIGTRQVGTEWHPSEPMSNARHYFYWVFREDERRELIAGAICNYLLGHVDSYCLKDGECHEERLKKFFKEQGV